MASRVLTAVLAAALVATAAAAADKTKGTTLRGYTFGSDVDEYLGISKDICDIKKLLNSKTPDWRAAQAIYMDGKNARRADGSVMPMRQLATGTNYQFPFWAEYSKFFKTPIWLDDVAQRAFAGIQPFETDVERVQLIVKSLESSLQVATVMNKLDQTVAYAKAGKKADAQRTLDKAWAAFVGGNEDCGLWTVALKRANEFGTKETCEAAAAASAILKAFLAAQKAVAAGDAAAVQSARDAVQKNIIAVYMQAVITYAHEMYLDTQAKLPADEHQVEAYAFWRTIAPLVSAANKTAGEALDFWLFPGQPVTPDVDLKAARALGTAFDKYGLTVKDLGQYGRKQPDLGCKAYVAAATPGGILSTTDAKDSLRPADGAAAGAAKPSAAAAAAPKPAAAAAKPAGRRLRM